MQNPPRRHFLPWQRPLLAQAVSFLAGDWTGPGRLDLSGVLVVVPTRQAGRRLREALATFAAERGSAVFPPRVLTPEGLVSEADGDAEASRLEATLAWVDVLRSVELSAYRAVFPTDPPSRNLAWALRLSEQLGRLQRTLAENGLRIADVPERVPPDFPELERWEQLAALEEKQQARLEGRLHSHGQQTGSPGWLAGIDRVVLLATADPLPAAITLLAAQVEVAVDVLVYAPEELATAFDGWGRPVEAEWERREIVVRAFAERVHLCAGPAEQAERIVRLAGEYKARQAPLDEVVALGAPDSEVLSLIEAEATRAGLRVFNPEGRRRLHSGLYQLLSVLTGFRGVRTFAEVEALARCPDVLSCLAVRCGPGFSTAQFLNQLDGLRAKHLPADLVAARRHARGAVAAALDLIAGWDEKLTGGVFPENVAEILGEIFRHRTFGPGDADLRSDAEAWRAVLLECRDAAEHFPALESRDWTEIALRLFAETSRSEDRPAEALVLHGWLELLFEDAPHLAIAGFNDGVVPEAVIEDGFLPESLHRRLGLRTGAARFARDAYLLTALARSRDTSGRLEVLYGKLSTAGDPLRPSRLLLRCADAELPERVALLFRTPAATQPQLAWKRAWKLSPRALPPPSHVAVTALRRWLACPFRFYLHDVLRMREVDAAKTELDVFDFGTLCHAALEAMGGDDAMRDCTDPGQLREFLLQHVTRTAHAKFGAELTLPLTVQLESARQRLGRFAEVQARERAAGWRIEAVEQPFEVPVGDITVKGKIDRIDRHETSGAVRVLDYKTSDSGIAPRVAHLRTVRPTETLPDWAVVSMGGDPRAWIDLQLPLYRHALAPRWGDAIALGYVTLPKAVSETSVLLWDDYTLDLHDAAMRCAGAICASITGGVFWPPNENIRPNNDDFGALFHHGVAESVQWSGSAPAVSRDGGAQ